MIFREEIKIPIPLGSESNIESLIVSMGAIRQYESRRVSSFYFDTKDLKYYRDSMEGVYPRKKVRLRVYSDPLASLQISRNTHFNLEMKIGTSVGDQKSVEPYTDAIRALATGIYIENRYLQNVCMVSYIRDYFLLDNLRLTIDRNISFAVGNNSNIQCKFHRESVLEIKTANFKLASHLVAKLGLQTRRFSKYCTCVEAVGLLNNVNFGI